MNYPIQLQRSEWKKKGWSIPDLRGGKQEWFPLIVELVQLIGTGTVHDLSEIPVLKTVSTSYPWRTYAPLLRGLGLASNQSGNLSLTENGIIFRNSLSKYDLARLFNERYRLFGEILALLKTDPKTVEEVDKILCAEYNLDWINLSNTRRRMDWLEILNLIQCVGNRKWGLTEDGCNFLNDVIIISPDALVALTEAEDFSIMPPPAEIHGLLQALRDDPSLHKKRNTYNIWVPSPNRIENLRMIVQFSLERVTRTELFGFIQQEFNLKVSSVESMMPFLKADGLLEEVGRNVYVATSAARSWYETGNDIDFIRLLHFHRRFVGELLAYTKKDTVRNDIYAQSKKYGLNAEKTRWIIGFLLEAGLVEETQYLHVKTTPAGLKVLAELPLADTICENEADSNGTSNVIESKSSQGESNESEDDTVFDELTAAARNPVLAGKASGAAFEDAIATVFRLLGFDAKRIGGPGDTDVIVRWKDDEGKANVAVVDGKSKTNGGVVHSDISDVAIETHKEKNCADYVAIIGPGFSGDTIKSHARKKGFALLTDSNLIDIAKNSKALGLSLTEISLLFKVPNGLSQLDELITTRKREMDIVTLVVSTFKQEQEAMDSLSARDLYFLLRRTNISPSLEELISVFETLSKDEIGILTPVKKASSQENITFSIREEMKSINRLRALASAIEKGLS